MAAATKTARDLTAEVAYRTRALKAPTLRESVPRLAERARAGSRSHEEFLVACLQTRGVRPRGARRRGGPHPRRPVPRPQELGGVRLRPRPRPQHDVIAHLGTPDFVASKENVVFRSRTTSVGTTGQQGFAVRAETDHPDRIRKCCQAAERDGWSSSSSLRGAPGTLRGSKDFPAPVSCGVLFLDPVNRSDEPIWNDRPYCHHAPQISDISGAVPRRRGKNGNAVRSPVRLGRC